MICWNPGVLVDICGQSFWEEVFKDFGGLVGIYGQSSWEKVFEAGSRIESSKLKSKSVSAKNDLVHHCHYSLIPHSEILT